jgi:hypothetical protein
MFSPKYRDYPAAKLFSLSLNSGRDLFGPGHCGTLTGEANYIKIPSKLLRRYPKAEFFIEKPDKISCLARYGSYLQRSIPLRPERTCEEE